MDINGADLESGRTFRTPLLPPFNRRPSTAPAGSDTDDVSIVSSYGSSWRSSSEAERPLSLLQRMDKYLFEEREVGIPWSRSHRAVIRVPCRVALQLGRIVFSFGFYSFLNLLIFTLPFAIVADRTHGSQSPLTISLQYASLASLPGIFRYGCEFLPTAVPERFAILKVGLIALFETVSIDLEVALIALFQRRLRLVQAYTCGKVVATCLLSPGITQFLSGFRRFGSIFNPTASSTQASLLVTAFVPFGLLFSAAQLNADISRVGLPALLVLMTLYGLYLFFKTRSHAGLYDAYSYYSSLDDHPQVRNPGTVLSTAMVTIPAALAYYLATKLGFALDEAPMKSHLSPVFVGFFLVPVLAEAAELPQILRLVPENRMDQVLHASAGTGVQMALFTAPILLLIALALHLPHPLQFGPFETIALFTSLWVFAYWASRGSSTYLTGALNVGQYAILCLTAFLHPNA